MLDKSTQPTIEEMKAYCKAAEELFLLLNDWLSEAFATEQTIVFPYGYHYGWGIAYKKKKKLICNVFPEDGAFCVMLRLNNAEWESLYGNVSDYMKEYIDNKYPCSEGGWIHYRVRNQSDMADIKKALGLRCK